MDTPLCPHIIASDHTEKQPPQETPLHFQHPRNVTHAQIPLARGTNLISDLSWKMAMAALEGEHLMAGNSWVEGGRGGKSALGKCLHGQHVLVWFVFFSLQHDIQHFLNHQFVSRTGKAIFGFWERDEGGRT